uniref:Cell morphogenesis protein C-terminal domain-containing protein n=1 Tax=Panagrolaimus superbus TaxID=310955 RepID=A0A914ZBN0_9BILA
MSLSPDHVIILGKRIAKHLLNACGERFIAILVNQLSLMTEQFKMTLVRLDVAPYYRWQLSHSDEEPMPTDETKKEEEEEIDEMVETEKDLNSSSLVNCEKSESLNQSHGNLPKELPMPAYGGFYADLRPLLLVSNQHVVHFTKSNLALFLLCDLIGGDEDFSVDWNNHLTTIVHSSVLCLDAVRPLVCRHARKALINIALLYATPGTNTGVVANLLQNNVIEMERLEVIEKYSGTNDDVSIFYSNGTVSTLSQRTETPSFAAALHVEYRQMLLHSKSVFNSSTDLLQALIFCLSERMDKPLWINEDVGQRGWRIESSEQLSCFVYHLAQYLNGCNSNFNFKWTDVAISSALCINNRHLAGRSFQIASALCQNPTPWIGRMLSRLAELVGDHNEDTQGYITHMMLCLHSLVPYVRITLEESARSLLHSPSSPTGHNRSISYTPALLSNQQQQNAQFSTTTPGSTTASPLKNSPINNIISPSHSSYKKDARHSMLIENEMPSTAIQTAPFNRSKSAATLKVDTSLTNEDSIGAFVQLMSIAVAMLESHVDNEYLLALTLMDKLLEAAGPDRECCLQRLHKTIKELDWCGFCGIIGLVCKGVVYTSGYETTVSLLVKCTSLLHEPAVASPNSFSLIVTAILPYLINGFDNMTPLCITAAQTISDYCVEHLPETAKDVPELTIQDHPLSYLSTMMIQYRNNSFTRDRFQWTKCVVNYLIDAEKPNSVQLVVFLAEVCLFNHLIFTDFSLKIKKAMALQKHL